MIKHAEDQRAYGNSTDKFGAWQATDYGGIDDPQDRNGYIRDHHRKGDAPGSSMPFFGIFRSHHLWYEEIRENTNRSKGLLELRDWINVTVAAGVDRHLDRLMLRPLNVSM